jgi:hypothetical protein
MIPSLSSAGPLVLRKSATYSRQVINRPEAPRTTFLPVAVGFSQLPGHDRHEKYDSQNFGYRSA